jgi:hypothetical protein
MSATELPENSTLDSMSPATAALSLALDLGPWASDLGPWTFTSGDREGNGAAKEFDSEFHVPCPMSLVPPPPPLARPEPLSQLSGHQPPAFNRQPSTPRDHERDGAAREFNSGFHVLCAGGPVPRMDLGPWTLDLGPWTFTSGDREGNGAAKEFDSEFHVPCPISLVPPPPPLARTEAPARLLSLQPSAFKRQPSTSERP